MFCCSRVRALPKTVVNLAKAVLPGMLSRGEGQFAAVSSMAACVPFVGYAAYAPAKVACRSLMDVLRNEHADTPLQFHVAFPPDTETPGFEKENVTKPYETSHVFPEVFNERANPNPNPNPNPDPNPDPNP